MTTEDKNKIDKARLKYKPERVKTLLVAEAPPDSLERFFYYENVRERDYLFLGVTEALYSNLKKEFVASGRNPVIKTAILNKLKNEGYYLIDLSDTPISLLNNVAVETFATSLIEKVKKIADTNTNIILIKANVYDSVYNELFNLGYKVVNVRIPFPSSGQQTNFQRTFKHALRLINKKKRHGPNKSTMKEIDEYKLTRDITVGQLQTWIEEKTENSKKEIVNLIRHRFENRYLKHIKCIDSGFLIMAVSCFVIETLQSFWEGVPDTNGKGERMFKNFFKNEQDNFSGFNEKISIEFYKHIRCGILHQSETTNAWRVLRVGNLLDEAAFSINAELFLESLNKSVNKYLDKLAISDFNSDIWKNAFIKLQDICDNCERK